MRRALAFLLLALGACGDPDYSGMYRVTVDLVDSTGCGAGVIPPNPPQYFQVKTTSLFGVKFTSVNTCTSTDPATCNGGGGVSPGFDLSTGDTTSCTLEHYEATVSGDDTSVTFDQKIYGVMNQPINPCTAKEAGNRGTSMPCIAHTTLSGTRL